MAEMGPATHTRKKPFQAPITSYFDRSHDVSRPQRMSSPMSPALPEATQAGLISVGMRVRKSVHEGYKTPKTVDRQETAYLSSAPAAAASSPKISSSLCPRELMPFCGLHKTGGWAMQTVPGSSAPSILQADSYEDDQSTPALSTSQATIASTQDSLPSPPASNLVSKKRTYEDEAEDDLDEIFKDIDKEIFRSRELSLSRPIAKLKGTSQRPGPAVRDVVQIANADEFEEASFLAPSDGMDID